MQHVVRGLSRAGAYASTERSAEQRQHVIAFRLVRNEWARAAPVNVPRILSIHRLPFPTILLMTSLCSVLWHLQKEFKIEAVMNDFVQLTSIGVCETFN
jgi:hypothetical protein